MTLQLIRASLLTRLPCTTQRTFIIMPSIGNSGSIDICTLLLRWCCVKHCIKHNKSFYNQIQKLSKMMLRWWWILWWRWWQWRRLLWWFSIYFAVTTHYLDHNGAAASRFLLVLRVAIDVREMRTIALQRRCVAGFRMMLCHALFELTHARAFGPPPLKSFRRHCTLCSRHPM